MHPQDKSIVERAYSSSKSGKNLTDSLVEAIGKKDIPAARISNMARALNQMARSRNKKDGAHSAVFALADPEAVLKKVSSTMDKEVPGKIIATDISDYKKSYKSNKEGDEAYAPGQDRFRDVVDYFRKIASAKEAWEELEYEHSRRLDKTASDLSMMIKQAYFEGSDLRQIEAALISCAPSKKDMAVNWCKKASQELKEMCRMTDSDYEKFQMFPHEQFATKVASDPLPLEESPLKLAYEDFLHSFQSAKDNRKNGMLIKQAEEKCLEFENSLIKIAFANSFDPNKLYRREDISRGMDEIGVPKSVQQSVMAEIGVGETEFEEQKKVKVHRDEKGRPLYDEKGKLLYDREIKLKAKPGDPSIPGDLVQKKLKSSMNWNRAKNLGKGLGAALLIGAGKPLGNMIEKVFSPKKTIFQKTLDKAKRVGDAAMEHSLAMGVVGGLSAGYGAFSSLGDKVKKDRSYYQMLQKNPHIRDTEETKEMFNMIAESNPVYANKPGQIGKLISTLQEQQQMVSPDMIQSLNKGRPQKPMPGALQQGFNQEVYQSFRQPQSETPFMDQYGAQMMGALKGFGG